MIDIRVAYHRKKVDAHFTRPERTALLHEALKTDAKEMIHDYKKELLAGGPRLLEEIYSLAIGESLTNKQRKHYGLKPHGDHEADIVPIHGHRQHRDAA